ncbi:MAG: pyridinium-3,5-bisthiocarboxylic acid mononucleotide nickel chelatase, partial [Candidatus Humimicrobiaceae bacterium]|nr:pyridinium-3,5-bisthiocarboxylic acid mononucleotide nickel chelatase [Candidatus Humimicrobiaceae bacterium]
PDVLRLVRGVTKDEYKFNEDRLIMLSANVDDSTPEIIGNLMEELFRQDIADAWVESIYMKKNRPAFKICVLCREELEKKIANMIMLETTTLGIRREKIKRYLADRELKIVKLPYGEVKVKTGILEGKVINISPEFESCKKLAEKTGKTLKEIYQDALLFFSKK